MKVAIVGLGAAGLRTAMLLEQAGVTVQLFEARGRLGGRIFTRDENGAVYDAGGEWLDSDHVRTLTLLNELGLEPDRSSGWPSRIYYKGQHGSAESLWSDALEDELRVEAAAREMTRDLRRCPWENRHRQDLEKRTLADFLAEHTRSERGLWWVTAKYRSDEGDDPKNISLLGWLCGYMHYLERDADAVSAYRVPGGMGSMIKAMAAKVQAHPHLDSVLKQVGQDSQSVTLQFETHEVEVDRAILTLPPPALESVVFNPPMPSLKRCAIEACGMSRAIKICFQFREKFWEEMDWGGSLFCSGPLQQVWDGSRGGKPILCAYVCGDDARFWANKPDSVQAALKELSKMVPEAQDQFVRGWLHDWGSDPFSRGSFSHLAPGYVLDYMEHIAKPLKRVHFAGEHTALWIGFIEGALESAERVSEEVLRAL